jgi:hypothetical protein
MTCFLVSFSSKLIQPPAEHISVCLSVLQLAEVFVIVFLALLPGDVRLVQLLCIYADFFNSWFYILERVLFSILIFE